MFIIILAAWVAIAISLFAEYAPQMKEKNLLDQAAVFLILSTAAPIFFLNNVLTILLGCFLELEE